MPSVKKIVWWVWRWFFDYLTPLVCIFLIMGLYYDIASQTGVQHAEGKAILLVILLVVSRKW